MESKMKTFNEFISESSGVKINKAVNQVIADILNLYNIDLTPHITLGNKRNFFVFDTSELDENQFNNIQRFANDKGLRHEPGGYKKYAIYLK